MISLNITIVLLLTNILCSEKSHNSIVKKASLNVAGGGNLAQPAKVVCNQHPNIF